MVQVPVGRAVRSLLDSLNISYFELDREDEANTIVDGALVTCFGARVTVAVLITSKLTGGRKH